MATAVFGNSNPAAPCKVRGLAKFKGALGSDVVLVQQRDYRVHQTMSDRLVVATEKTALLRRSEFDAIAKNVRVGYVFFFDDRDEYLEGNRVVG